MHRAAAEIAELVRNNRCDVAVSFQPLSGGGKFLVVVLPTKEFREPILMHGTTVVIEHQQHRRVLMMLSSVDDDTADQTNEEQRSKNDDHHS